MGWVVWPVVRIWSGVACVLDCTTGLVVRFPDLGVFLGVSGSRYGRTVTLRLWPSKALVLERGYKGSLLGINAVFCQTADFVPLFLPWPCQALILKLGYKGGLWVIPAVFCPATGFFTKSGPRP